MSTFRRPRHYKRQLAQKNARAFLSNAAEMSKSGVEFKPSAGATEQEMEHFFSVITGIARGMQPEELSLGLPSAPTTHDFSFKNQLRLLQLFDKKAALERQIDYYSRIDGGFGKVMELTDERNTIEKMIESIHFLSGIPKKDEFVPGGATVPYREVPTDVWEQMNTGNGKVNL